MKIVSTQLAYFLDDKQVQRNIWSLLRLVALVVAVVLVFTVLFHVIMVHVEGREYSWMTGFYWTLTVMSTLGFGDITFQSDIGRLFTVVVLISGIVLLLIVLPFAFIRFFYAPWLEARLRMRAPRAAPADVEGHVIICDYDSIGAELIRRLEQEGTPYFLIEPDPAAAAERYVEGLSVVSGDVDSKNTYEALRAAKAQMVLANQADTINTNITLTVREVAPDVPVVATAGYEDSIDVLELSGATHVLPLKKWLGEQLANRVGAVHAQSNVIGQYEDLLIAELPAHNTPLAGRTIRETKLRQATGLSIIGIWQRGTVMPVRPDLEITKSSVLVVAGTADQLEALDDLFVIYDVNPNPVLLVGGGRVGRAAAHALHRRDVAVHLIERDPVLCERLRGVCTEVFAGDASDYELLRRAGLQEAPSVLLTTNDDAMNIYLASYCRRLNAELRIVSRITHERNLEAIHRAGADFVLSYTTLGVESVFSILKKKKFIMLGEGVDLFPIPLPPALHGQTLAESEIGAHTGLSVVALRQNGQTVTALSAATELPAGAELLVMGSRDQRKAFMEHFDA